MSFLSKLFGGEAAPVASAVVSDRVHILDGERFIEGRGGPVERVNALRRLAPFVAREKIRLQVVFGGKPLREVEHGGEFEGIRVYFAESPETLAAQMQKLAEEAGRSRAFAIVGDKRLEDQLMGDGIPCLRVTTFRKAFETEGEDRGGEGRDRRDRNGRDGRDGRRMRPPRGDRRHSRHEGGPSERAPQEPDPAYRPSAPATEPGSEPGSEPAGEPAAAPAPSTEAPPAAAPSGESAPAPAPASTPPPAPRPPPSSAVRNLVDLVE